LANDKGFAVDIEPKRATLASFGSMTISVRCVGDTWGKYTDVLLCRTPAFPPKHICVKAEVTGSPLAVQISGTANAPGIIRMPTTCATVAGSDVPTAESSRRVRFINHSPFDVKLLWECVLVDPGSRKLIDFVPSYKEPGRAVATRVRAHEGEKCTTPFNCLQSSKTMTIPGRKRRDNHGHVDVVFASPNTGDFTGFVRAVTEHAGRDHLIKKMLSEEAIAAGVGVDRTRQEYESTALKANLTGTALAPLLLPASGEKARFTLTVHDLHLDNDLGLTQCIVMSNPTEARIGCLVGSASPFMVRRVLTSSGQLGDLSAHGAVLVDPRGSVEVMVALDPSSLADSGEPDPATGRLDIAGALSFGYSDGTTHCQDLLASLYYPLLSTSTSTVDFGTVRNPVTVTVTVRNDGRSAAPWHVVCPDGPFSCVAVGDGRPEGILEAFTSHTAAVTADFAVTYTPGGECKAHGAVLRVCSPLHKDIEVALSGVGTLDEAFA